MDPLERVIRPIVEGQIRGFLKEHPVIVESVDWFKPRKDKAVTFTNSLSKRIVRDLACPMSRGRLVAALLQGPGDEQPKVADGIVSVSNGEPVGTSESDRLAFHHGVFIDNRGTSCAL